MPRFYVPQPRIENGMLQVEGNEVKHIRRVLRLGIGDEILVFDGSGREYQGVIVEERGSSLTVRVENVLASKRESPLEVVLAQSLLKGEKMDYLVQKATELGVTRIVPFLSSRSVSRMEKSGSLKHLHRWEKIAVEASKQCGRGMISKIEPIRNYSEMLEKISSDFLKLILWEQEGSSLREILARSQGQTKIFFIVGPEGGLSKEEVDCATEKGFSPILLGGRILRAETASLCLLSILQYDRGDIG